MNHKPPTILLISTIVLAFGACRSDELDAQEELQDLLHDEHLTQVPPGVAGGPVTPEARRAPTTAAAIPFLQNGEPLGVWDFNDCNSFHTQLSDSSWFANAAFRSVNAACIPGLEGSGVAIAGAKDIIYVPDQPDFTFENGVTVAGWFNPTTTGGSRTLLRKRDGSTSSFVLLLKDQKFQFVVRLADGRAISVASPMDAKTGVFQHVAGTYDGTTLRLYVDGSEVASGDEPGTIALGPGPLLMGNDGSERRFDGTIDNTLLVRGVATADEVRSLTCSVSPTLVVAPSAVLAALPGVPVTIDVALSNHNAASCAPLSFEMAASVRVRCCRQPTTGLGLTLDPPASSSVQSAPVPSGTTGHLTVTATVTDQARPDDTFFVELSARELTSGFSDFGFNSVAITVAGPPGCHVSDRRELFITDFSVVEDPVRIAFDPTSADPRNGVWTFKHLVENMAPTPADAPAMVEKMLTSFTTPQIINGLPVAARPGMQQRILNEWSRTPDGALDLARAPLRLLAIVNRFDLRDLVNGNAGELGFIFAFTASPEATLMFEYKLPAAIDQDVLDWAQAFHALGALPFDEDYRAALQAITERVVGRGVRPGLPNGSAIDTVRTNEIAFGHIWELREFRLSPISGVLEPAPLALTPFRGFDASPTLASYINANQNAILAETHTVPPVFDGQPFQAGAVFNDFTSWLAPGVDPETRHHFALNTCNGCHSFSETRTPFLQVSQPGFGEAALSGFLTGITVNDPVTGQPRTFNDLARRNADLAAIVCVDPATLPRETLRKGISRVH